MPFSNISIVDFVHEFVCLVVISLVSILRCLKLESCKIKVGDTLKIQTSLDL